MSFNIQNLHQRSYGNGHSTWYYYDSTDNIASLAAGVVNTGYFKAAYDTHGIVMKQGDIIDAAYVTSANIATSVRFTVPATWDANGASIVAQYH